MFFYCNKIRTQLKNRFELKLETLFRDCFSLRFQTDLKTDCQIESRL